MGTGVKLEQISLRAFPSVHASASRHKTDLVAYVYVVVPQTPSPTLTLTPNGPLPLQKSCIRHRLWWYRIACSYIFRLGRP